MSVLESTLVVVIEDASVSFSVVMIVALLLSANIDDTFGPVSFECASVSFVPSATLGGATFDGIESELPFLTQGRTVKCDSGKPGTLRISTKTVRKL